MTITLDNLEQYGIGHNFSDPIYPQDFEGIALGADLEDNMVTEDPTTMLLTTPNGGTTPWWKEPSYDRWWKVGLRGNRDEE